MISYDGGSHGPRAAARVRWGSINDGLEAQSAFTVPEPIEDFREVTSIPPQISNDVERVAGKE